MQIRIGSFALALGALTAASAFQPSIGAAQARDAKRPMTFLDMRTQRAASAFAPSTDGKWLLYTLTSPDWKEAKSQSDVFLVSLDQGVRVTRQMTFTRDKNEITPRWSRDGSFFVFASNREAPASAAVQNQLFKMRPDGGEALRITDAKDGVSTFAFSRDGEWLVYRSGKAGEEQLFRVAVAGLDSGKAEQITRQPTGVGLWRWSPDSKRIYFITADTVDADEKLRTEKKFTVNIRNPEMPTSSLWAIDLDPRRTTRLTRDTAIAVTDFQISPDGRSVGFRGVLASRYKRNITEQNINADLYLLDVTSGQIERLTDNKEVGESAADFSPDSKWVAFSGPDDLTRYTMTNSRVYLRRVDDRGGQWKKLGQGFDGNVSVGFWSKDGRTIYFNEGIRATNQVLALDIETNKVRQLTQDQASTSASMDDDAGTLLITHANPSTPTTLYTIAAADQIGTRAAWRQLTDPNPEARTLALGDAQEISWKSTDGKTVGGVLIKPVGYQSGRRYPLIVAIHGGPAGADILGFNGGYGAQVYAGAGYAVLMPNYRGSTNYGQAHLNGIVGNYFKPGYDDIMTGVDQLIAQGIVDSTQMGVLGWSAGGHWSNWILTHTTRFKAISTGAGTMNWISMYAQSDVQRNRQYYLGDKLPYDDFDAYWNQSPLKYIKNAKTPTMIHVVDGDPRVPRPQSEELHMALRQLGVPTEFYVYPGNTHGIPDPRNQQVKSVAEMAWMDYWVRGLGKKFAWRDVLKTLESEVKAEPIRP